jgi:hypothetical protein
MEKKQVLSVPNVRPTQARLDYPGGANEAKKPQPSEFRMEPRMGLLTR